MCGVCEHSMHVSGEMVGLVLGVCGSVCGVVCV